MLFFYFIFFGVCVCALVLLMSLFILLSFLLLTAFSVFSSHLHLSPFSDHRRCCFSLVSVSLNTVSVCFSCLCIMPFSCAWKPISLYVFVLPCQPFVFSFVNTSVCFTFEFLSLVLHLDSDSPQNITVYYLRFIRAYSCEPLDWLF